MSQLLLQLTLASLPFIYLWVFFRRHTHLTKRRLFVFAGALGCVMVFPTVFVSMPLLLRSEALGSSWQIGLGRAFLAASLPEEVAKYLVIYILLLVGQKQIPALKTEPRLSLLLGACVGFGFGLMENLYYLRVARLNFFGSITIAVVRTITALPCHLFLGCIMAYYLSRGLAEERRIFKVVAFALPFVLHGMYDFPLLVMHVAPEEMVLSLLVLSWMGAWTYFKFRRLKRLEKVAVL
jgi:RsiW-degrading membrane proteinase PrsW (M82 family)